MVKNRGIEVAIISQFDIRRLPEFNDPEYRSINQNNIVSCYVPIHPGAQIWFEYTIEPPHPPDAAYFFKLLVNKQVVTAWDCTEKHGYHGKTIYLLEKTEVHQTYPRSSVQRRGFKFCHQEDALDVEMGDPSDCIEVRVHRIEHRKRIHNDLPARDRSLIECPSGQLEFVDGGILEAGRPQRRYKYQLLDPVDVPYAVFRFFYRTYEFLWQQNIIVTPASSIASTSSSPNTFHNARSASMTNDRDAEILEQNQDIRPGSKKPEISPKEMQTTHNHTSPTSNGHLQDINNNTFIPLSDSDESLSVIARDSIDELPSTVPRSPETLQHRRSGRRGSVKVTASPTKQPNSPRKKLKNQLALNLDGLNLNPEKRKRPLSPFTSGGLLRRIITPEPPPSAPSTLICFSPSADDEERESIESRRPECRDLKIHTSHEVTGSEGSGRSLIRFLSRRVTRHE